MVVVARELEGERGLPDLDRQAYARAIKLLADEMSEVLGTERSEVRAMLESAWEGNKLN